jgi:Protein kinase domain
VYLATHEGLQRKVALKLLAPDYADDEAFRARFLRESRMAAAIDHPNIIPIYEAGEIDGAYFLAMRYVAGTDLETRLRTGPLEPREAVHILGQVASALDAAHEQSLIHRDIKPANVLIATGKGVEKADHAYLTDFGLTKHRGSQSGLTEASAFIGTLDYIAPEQIEGKPVDGRTDQYGLACVAFQCLAGRIPFLRDTDIAIAMAHLRDAPPSAVELRPELPHAVDAVLARGMAKRPDDRYPTCEAFVVALRQALGVRPTEERPAPATGERRTRRLVVGAAAVALVGVAAVALGAWGLGQAAGPAPSTSASAESSAAAASGEASAAPSAGGSGTGSDAFPNEAEQALLAKLEAVPGGLAATCARGSYAAVPPGYVPLASLECSPDIATGASQVIVRQFRSRQPASSTVKSIFAVAYPFGGLPAGDCGRESPAIGPWSLAGEPRGTLACYMDEATGDALLYWSYDKDEILVRARNPRGDSKALYDFFDSNARFISP